MNPLFIDNLDFSRKKYIKKESFFKKKSFNITVEES